VIEEGWSSLNRKTRNLVVFEEVVGKNDAFESIESKLLNYGR
jgi:hypothetical protein